MKNFLQILLYVSQIFAQHERYCNPEWCKDNEGRILPHIGCPKNTQSMCPNDVRSIEMTDELQQLIVNRHNELRNLLAGGNLMEFGSAIRMPTIVRDYVSY